MSAIPAIDVAASAIRKIPSLQGNVDDAGTNHAKCPGRADRNVNDAASNEGASVIDAAAYRAARMRDRHHAPHRSGPMRACHLAPGSTAVIIRSKACLGVRRGSRDDEKYQRQNASVHGASLVSVTDKRRVTRRFRLAGEFSASGPGGCSGSSTQNGMSCCPSAGTPGRWNVAFDSTLANIRHSPRERG